jgi:hypothetical protein
VKDVEHQLTVLSALVIDHFGYHQGTLQLSQTTLAIAYSQLAAPPDWLPVISKYRSASDF